MTRRVSGGGADDSLSEETAIRLGAFEGERWVAASLQSPKFSDKSCEGDGDVEQMKVMWPGILNRTGMTPCMLTLTLEPEHD